MAVACGYSSPSLESGRGTRDLQITCVLKRFRNGRRHTDRMASAMACIKESSRLSRHSSKCAALSVCPSNVSWRDQALPNLGVVFDQQDSHGNEPQPHECHDSYGFDSTSTVIRCLRRHPIRRPHVWTVRHGHRNWRRAPAKSTSRDRYLPHPTRRRERNARTHAPDRRS
jgi:hypothetical protein